MDEKANKRRIVSWGPAEGRVILLAAAQAGFDFQDYVRHVVNKALVDAGFAEQLVLAREKPFWTAEVQVALAESRKIRADGVTHVAAPPPAPPPPPPPPAPPTPDENDDSLAADQAAQDELDRKHAAKEAKAKAKETKRLKDFDEDEFSPEAVKRRLSGEDEGAPSGKKNPF